MSAAPLPTPIPKDLGTYVGETHTESDPVASLLPREREDLVWRYRYAAADIGIRCTFGAQLDAALSQRISDEAARDARAVARMRTLARKNRLPKRVRPELLTLLEYLGIDGATMTRRVELSDQVIYMRAPMHTAPADPYEGDMVMTWVRRLREIDRRRHAIGHKLDRTLWAVFGMSELGEDRITFGKRFGDLADVVVAIVASFATDTTAPARLVVRRKLHDDGFVRQMKMRAQAYLREAANAYARERDTGPREPGGPKWRSEPVWGDGEPGKRPLLGHRWVQR